ncbi:MAG: hypothetical protein WCW52_00110 [Elusimicrobiales bacterium]|jgi:hypothetical protein
MNNTEKFWSDKKDEALKKFGSDIEKAKDLSLDLTKTIITINATFLGLTLSLMGYLRKTPNCALLFTWGAEILAITFGLISFKQYIDAAASNSVDSFQFTFDLSDISQREARGEFVGKETERMGLILAAMIRRYPDGGKLFSKEQRANAKTYEAQLSTTKMFTPVENKSLLSKLTPSQSLVSELFYGLTVLSFIFLIFSILV